ncbi:hypothetical protein NYE48_27865 [Paenibacillus sp. FSL M7-1455]|uniref:hypothetical protein n=1 Tax=Paenibacillus sp. FSL M7-1455 TaxID=2975316 RepID=UPI0030F7FC7E
MAEIKAGTKVKVRKDLKVDEFYGGLRFHNGMSKYRGKIATVQGKPHYNNNAYGIDIDLEGYDWTSTMFEIVKA